MAHAHKKARLELNENPDILHQDIQQVRDMIITRPDIGFLRTDDAFILRFLRARKFHQTEAFRLLAQYFQYRQLNLDMFKNFKADDPGIKRALTDGFPGVLENRDHCGRKILLLFAANWDQKETDANVSRRLSFSISLLPPPSKPSVRLQLERGRLLLTFILLTDSFPARFGGVHFVNQPWYIHALYTLIKPFLKDKTRKRPLSSYSSNNQSLFLTFTFPDLVLKKVKVSCDKSKRMGVFRSVYSARLILQLHTPKLIPPSCLPEPALSASEIPT
uniref:Clavesin-1 n=1 Tax=Strix occidentalis caurina TaxID=311401 RepID=A0A8D0KRP8_STROC